MLLLMLLLMLIVVVGGVDDVDYCGFSTEHTLSRNN
jgi:hypothetical protein